MARKRVEVGLKSWEEADRALLAIGRLEREIAGYEAEAQESIEEIRAGTVIVVKPLQEQRAALELQLQAFCESRRDEFKGKSRVLNFGTVSFRASTKIVIRRFKACIDGLRKFGLVDYIRVKESPDKEKMKDLDDGVLAQVGAKRQAADAFGYELNQERVKEAA